MKSPGAALFGLVVFLVIICGFVLVVAIAQNTQLPQYAAYNETSSTINQTERMVMAPAVPMISLLIPILAGGFLVGMAGIVMFALGKGRRSGW